MKTLVNTKMMILSMAIAIIFLFAFPTDALSDSKPICKYDGCSIRRAPDSSYCYSHTCHHGKCKSKTIKYSSYCASHTCDGGRTICYREVSSANEKCSLCKSRSKKTTGSYSNSSSKKTTTTKNTYSSKNKSSSSTKKKYKMPDCDDYEDYDDFMDDWDGFMPDGSDAEDYWENW